MIYVRIQYLIHVQAFASWIKSVNTESMTKNGPP